MGLQLHFGQKTHKSFIFTEDASYSYEWYKLHEWSNGRLVINTYPYSSTTVRHISKVKKNFGYPRDYLAIYAPEGLNNERRSIEVLEFMLKSNLEAIGKARPRTKKFINLVDKDKLLMQSIKYLKEKLAGLE